MTDIPHRSLNSDAAQAATPPGHTASPTAALPGAPTRRAERNAVVAASIGYGLDGFDLLIASFALSGLIASFDLTPVMAGSLTSATLAGAVTGGVGLGLLSDRLGRVRVLRWSVVIFAVFTGLAALSSGYVELLALRFLAGVGIGGEFGIGMALAAEAVRPSHRARATARVGIGFQFGVIAAALASAPIISIFGWRGLFAVGALPAVAVFVLRGHLARSIPPDRPARRDRASIRQTFAGDRRRRRTTVTIGTIAIVQNFGYYGIMAWLPLDLAKRHDLGLYGSAVWTSVTVAGMIAGILTFGALADRLGRKRTLLIVQLGAVIIAPLYANVNDSLALLGAGFVLGFFANGMLGVIGALIADHYPSPVLATAQNLLFNIGRAVAGLAPILLASAADLGGFATAVSVLPVIYVIAMIATLALPPSPASAPTPASPS